MLRRSRSKSKWGRHTIFRGEHRRHIPCLHGDRSPTGIVRAILGSHAAKRALNAVQLDIELKVRQAFHGLLLARAFVDVAEQSLAQVERRYTLAQQQKAAGVTTQLEVIRANVQVVNTRSQLIQAQNQHKLAEEHFKLTLGLSLDDPVSIDGQLLIELKSVKVDQAIATALEQTP